MAMKRSVWQQYGTDAAGAAVLALIVVGGYTLLVHPSLSCLLRAQPVQRQHSGMQATMAALREQCQTVQVLLDEEQQRLARASARIPGAQATDELLMWLNEISAQCGVTVARWQPIGVELGAEYQAHLFVVEGTARFPALYRWFASVESGVSYLDVTHFAIQADPSGDQPCRFECSMRFYCNHPDAGEPVDGHDL
jgi:hypothetical protein